MHLGWYYLRNIIYFKLANFLNNVSALSLMLRLRNGLTVFKGSVCAVLHMLSVTVFFIVILTFFLVLCFETRKTLVRGNIRFALPQILLFLSCSQTLNVKIIVQLMFWASTIRYLDFNKLFKQLFKFILRPSLGLLSWIPTTLPSIGCSDFPIPPGSSRPYDRS